MTKKLEDYTLVELEQMYSTVDRDKHPDKHRAIEEERERRLLRNAVEEQNINARIDVMWAEVALRYSLLRWALLFVMLSIGLAIVRYYSLDKSISWLPIMIMLFIHWFLWYLIKTKKRQSLRKLVEGIRSK